MVDLAEKIKSGIGENPHFLGVGESEVIIVVIEHHQTLPCGCSSGKDNEPHPGFPLREHYGPSTFGPEQFTIIVSPDGRASHYACGRDVAHTST